MTPFTYAIGLVPSLYISSMYSEYGMLSSSVISTYNKFSIRPVINLKSDVLFSSGSGTESDPYIVKLN